MNFKHITMRVKKLASTVVLLGLMLPFAASAGIVSQFTDIMSNHTTSAVSNHTFQFVTPSGVGAGENILITFTTGFSLGTVSFDDMDLQEGSTSDCTTAIFADKTLAAVAAGATWGASVSGQQITFQSGTDTITADRCVQIKIGTNATSGGTGTDQITNPGSSGSKSIYVSGTFDDSGALAVPITSPGQVTVDATVTGGSSGGGGGGGGGGDSIPPVMSNIRETDMQSRSVEIRWETNEPANSFVDYGLTSSYGSGTVSNGSMVFSHVVTLTNLEPGTTYHYRVRSADAAGNEAISGDRTFTTLTEPDTTPPVISGVNVTNLTSTSASIGWTTDELADSLVEYGLTTAYGSQVFNGTLSTTHFLTISGLTPRTTYHFRVTSKDASLNSASSADMTFTTPDDTGPVISNIQVINISENEVTVTWTTDEPATSVVHYGPTNNLGSGESTPGFTTSHSVTLHGLAENTTYSFSVESTDDVGNISQSPIDTFNTGTDTTAPANVSNLTFDPGNTEVTLSWTNPTDADFAGVRIRRSTAGNLSGPNDGVQVANTQSTSYVDTGLTNDTTYYYGVFAYDVNGNFASGALGNATPEEPPVPVPPPQPPMCGDLVCEDPETPSSCSEDCPEPPPQPPAAPVCGDGACNGVENNDTCQVDCPLIEACGNGFCAGSESRDTCPADCGGPVSPEPPQNLGNLTLGDLSVTVLPYNVTIGPDANGNYDVLGGATIRVVIQSDHMTGGMVDHVTLKIGNNEYGMTEVRSYGATVTVPNASGLVLSDVTATYTNGDYDRLDFGLSLEGRGQVYEVTDDGEMPVAGATVTLFDSQGELWKGNLYGQVNPATTPADGSFVFIVQPGTYSLRAEHDGHLARVTEPFTSTGLVNPRLELIAVPPPPVDAIGDIIASNAPILEKIGAIAGVIGRETIFQLEQVRQSPEVRSGAEVAAPAAVAIAVVNTAAIIATTAGAAFNVFAYLQYFITAPFLWFGRRKRKGYGVVYDSLTKMPVELAVVRLLDDATGRVMQSRVTDRKGQYFFIASQGRYRLQVVKPGFVYPTVFLRGAKEDVKYTEVYHGEPINVSDTGVTIAANIPLDPVGKAFVPSTSVIRKFIVKRLQMGLALFGVIASAVSYWIIPRTSTLILGLIQLALLIVFWQIAKGKKPTGWGIVYDERTKVPLRNAVVRIFEPRYNKLLDTFVTDAQGRYSFVVGPNTYYTTYEKPGFTTVKLVPIDYSKTGESAVITYNVPMRSHEQPPPA